MYSIEKSVQTTNLQVFICRREEIALQDMRAQMNFEQRKVFKRAEVKVEEFILDQIGSFGMEFQQKRLENCYLRNLIISPHLFTLKQNKLFFLFDHHIGLLSHYIKQHRYFLRFKRLLRNLFLNRKR